MHRVTIRSLEKSKIIDQENILTRIWCLKPEENLMNLNEK